MLNVFPGLLIPFLAPLLLRLGLAAALAAAAYLQWARRDQIAQADLPVVGRGGWWVWFSVAAHAAVAALLVLGLYTQVAALVGALISLKHAFWARRYPLLFPLGRAAGLLMLVISLSLVLSGAGAFAQDLPL
jgi:uncharacterized membrane protein YphA (DoxX/SURF4 family)